MRPIITPDPDGEYSTAIVGNCVETCLFRNDGSSRVIGSTYLSAIAQGHIAEFARSQSKSPAQIYGALHSDINDRVSDHAGRSVSVTTGRTASGWYVISALTSKANGDLVRVIITLDGKRLDSETGTIADTLENALLAIPESARREYAQAWRDVFIPDSHDVVK